MNYFWLLAKRGTIRYGACDMSENPSSVLEQFHQLLAAAVEAGASDIHIKAGAPVRFRVSGELADVEAPEPDEQWLADLAKQIAPPLAQKRFEEQGEADFAYESPGTGRQRVNLFTQRGKRVFAFRMVKEHIVTLAELNLPPVVQHLAEKTNGLILVAGATGSGKSTTLAAMIEHVNLREKRHVVTLEDPIEYVFRDKMSVIEQREVGIDTGTFATGLKHVLRQDPDVIMIGEMRDAESFSAAMRAVNTGHLVISTLHSTRAAQTITRVLEFFEASEHEHARRQIAAGLLAVVCQELVHDVTGMLRPAVEVMVNNETIRGLIENGKLEALPQAIERGAQSGMQTFNQALMALVNERLITQETALRHSPNPEALRMNFKGIFSQI
ncbi:MAG TPA: PilT/PilU family type 4a pilus ATPase [Chthoniobacteraceae bacterium]|nr:PilT/PilU family type 4a pilus ATPase [Chthoniobacteraceae bacterium]